MNLESTDRRRMVDEQICARGISDGRLIAAMLKVPRHLFIPAGESFFAYEDRPLSIGSGQTISQPYMVAEMCVVADFKETDRVLEVGTGSGYAAAVISLLAAEVYSLERIPRLYEKAVKTLRELEYRNVEVLLRDGYRGYGEKSPFDVIMLSAAPSGVPGILIEQLAEGGRLVAPVGREDQYLIRITKTGQRLRFSRHGAVRFVPMKHGVTGSGGSNSNFRSL